MEGPLVAHTWVPPSVLPSLLPLLALMALLALRPNRDARAWWILAPIALAWVVEAGLNSSADLSSGAMELFGPLIPAMTFALAALWLLAGVFAGKHPVLSFLGATGILMLASMAAFLPGAISELDYTTVPIAIALLVGAFVTGLSLSLGALLCRRRWGAVRLGFWVLLCMALCMALTFGVILGLAAIGGSGPPLVEAVTAWLIATAVAYAFPLPFLVLSGVNSFYRARLQAWLHLRDAGEPGAPDAAPPVIETAAVPQG